MSKKKKEKYLFMEKLNQEIFSKTYGSPQCLTEEPSKFKKFMMLKIEDYTMLLLEKTLNSKLKE